MNTHPNLLSVADSLVIIIDIQPKLTAVMPENEAERMIINTQGLVTAADLLNVPVLVTEQYPKGLGCTETSISDLLPENTAVFSKTGFSCCTAEGFSKALVKTGRKQLILLGQETHVCVLQTALELCQPGFSVHVLEDTTCSRQTEHKFYALQRMQQQGVTLSNYESVLFEWLRDAKHPDFKTISALLT